MQGQDEARSAGHCAEGATHGLPLDFATPAAWSAVALQSIDETLQDHAHCEQKAAAAGLSLIGKCSEDAAVVRRMTALALEEIHHFKQVFELIRGRGGVLGPPRPDRYVRHLRRRGFQTEGGLGPKVDLLLINCLIEARSCERFRLLSAGLSRGEGDLPEPEREQLQAFYARLAAAEGRHWELFRDLAIRFAGRSAIAARLDQLSSIEGQIVAALPLEPRMH